jgi:hypothetical protein
MPLVPSPLLPQKRTFGCNAKSVAMGHNRTRALQHKNRKVASRRFLRHTKRYFD